MLTGPVPDRKNETWAVGEFGTPSGDQLNPLFQVVLFAPVHVYWAAAGGARNSTTASDTVRRAAMVEDLHGGPVRRHHRRAGHPSRKRSALQWRRPDPARRPCAGA